MWKLERKAIPTKVVGGYYPTGAKWKCAHNATKPNGTRTTHTNTNMWQNGRNAQEEKKSVWLLCGWWGKPKRRKDVMKVVGIESKTAKKLSRFSFHLNFVLAYLFLGHPSVSAGHARRSRLKCDDTPFQYQWRLWEQLRTVKCKNAAVRRVAKKGLLCVKLLLSFRRAAWSIGVEVEDVCTVLPHQLLMRMSAGSSSRKKIPATDKRTACGCHANNSFGPSKKPFFFQQFVKKAQKKKVAAIEKHSMMMRRVVENT